MKHHALVALVLAMLTCGSAATACAWNPPVNIADAAYADLVFEGRVTDYTTYAYADRPDEVAYATARFDVVSVLKGSPGAEVTVVMLFSMVSFPEQLTLPGTVYVAAVSVETAENPLPEFPVLLHPMCGTAFMVPATSDNRAQIMAAMAAQ